MNYRLLSDAEKCENARARWRRNRAQKKQKRRGRLLNALASRQGLTALISPEQAFVFAFGDLNRARRIARSLVAAVAATDRGDVGRRIGIKKLERPARCLRASNRAAVFPRLVTESLVAGAAPTLPEALVAVKVAQKEGSSVYALLDLFSQIAMLPLNLAARILREQELVAYRFSPSEIEAVRRARSFWISLEDGRAVYRAMTGIGAIASAPGELAFFDAQGLTKLLPGLRLPKALVRTEYCVSAQRDRHGLLTGLDLYSANYSELVTHPLLSTSPTEWSSGPM